MSAPWQQPQNPARPSSPRLRSNLNPAATPFRPTTGLTSVSARLQVGPPVQPSSIRCTSPWLPLHYLLIASGWRRSTGDDGHSYLVGPGVDAPITEPQDHKSEDISSPQVVEDTVNAATRPNKASVNAEIHNQEQEASTHDTDEAKTPQGSPSAQKALEADDLESLLEFAPYYGLPKDDKDTDDVNKEGPGEPKPDSVTAPKLEETSDGSHMKERHISDSHLDGQSQAEEDAEDWVVVQDADLKPVSDGKCHPSARNGATLAGVKSRSLGGWLWRKK